MNFSSLMDRNAGAFYRRSASALRFGKGKAEGRRQKAENSKAREILAIEFLLQTREKVAEGQMKGEALAGVVCFCGTDTLVCVSSPRPPESARTGVSVPQRREATNGEWSTKPGRFAFVKRMYVRMVQAEDVR